MRLLLLATLLTSACAQAARLPEPSAPEVGDPRHEVVHLGEDALHRVAGTAGSTWLAPSVRALRPFDRLLVSWNVDVEGEEGSGAFDVEVRVVAAGERSPWLFVGSWGTPTGTADRTTEFAGGRIDVDAFVGSRTFDGAEVRVRCDDRGRVVPRRITLCFTSPERGESGVVEAASARA